jgi:hypothetical protein
VIAIDTPIVVMRGRYVGCIGVVTSLAVSHGVLVEIDEGTPLYFCYDQISELKTPDDEMGEVPCC